MLFVLNSPLEEFTSLLSLRISTILAKVSKFIFLFVFWRHSTFSGSVSHCSRYCSMVFSRGTFSFFLSFIQGNSASSSYVGVFVLVRIVIIHFLNLCFASSTSSFSLQLHPFGHSVFSSDSEAATYQFVPVSDLNRWLPLHLLHQTLSSQ